MKVRDLGLLVVWVRERNLGLVQREIKGDLKQSWWVRCKALSSEVDHIEPGAVSQEVGRGVIGVHCHLQ